jgi:hypothetical protein
VLLFNLTFFRAQILVLAVKLKYLATALERLFAPASLDFFLFGDCTTDLINQDEEGKGEYDDGKK